MKALVLLWLGLGGGAALAEDPAAGYAAGAELVVQGGESLQRLRLPLAVLQATRRPGWTDLRLLDASGATLPWAWAAPARPPAAPAPRRQPLAPLPWPASAGGQPAPQVKIEWRGDGSVLRIEHSGPGAAAPASAASAATEPQAWLLDLKPLGEARPTALWLDWAPQAQAGLVLPVRAESSADAQQWQGAGQAVLVELAGSGARQVLQARLELPGLAAGQRYLRLVADTGWPLRAAAAEFDRPAPTDDTALDRLSLPVPSDGVLDLGTALPVKQLQFTLAGGASVLPLAVQRRADTTPGAPAAWWPVAQHTAWRLQQDGRWQQSPPLVLDGTLARHWRLRAAGAGTSADTPPPGALPAQVELAWTAPQIVFVASGRPPYRLLAGRVDASDAALPLAALMPGYQPGAEHRLPAATLGPLQTQGGGGNAWSDASPAQRRRWLLWAALVAAVLVLAGLALRLAREMGSAPAGPPPAPPPPPSPPAR